MRVHVTELNDGDRLSGDIFNSYGLNILSKGTILQAGDISKLLQHHVEYVEIDARDTGLQSDEETAFSPNWFPKASKLYQRAVGGIELLFKQSLDEGIIKNEDVSDAFQPLVDNMKMERDVVSMLLLLNTKDDYTYQHSVQVGMISYYIAKWLDYDDHTALRIGKAGYLHDIGKCRIDLNILNKPGKLTTEEFEQIKKHPLFGYEIINNSFQDDMIALAALQHHERMNSSGYPNGISGGQIHPAAKIVAVADIYSAMISTRVYRDKRDLMFVLKELYRMSFHDLDPLTTHTFIRHMVPNFIGKTVELKSGAKGIIVMTNTSDFFRPLVRVRDRFVDLSADHSDEIKEVFM